MRNKSKHDYRISTNKKGGTDQGKFTLKPTWVSELDNQLTYEEQRQLRDAIKQEKARYKAVVEMEVDNRTKNANNLMMSELAERKRDTAVKRFNI